MYHIYGFNEGSGSADEFPLDQRIFNAATFCSSILGAIFIIMNLFNSQLNWLTTLALAIFFLLNIAIYFISRFGNRNGGVLRIIFFASTVICLIIGLYTSGGIFGNIPYYFVLAFLSYLAVFKLKYHILISIVMFGIITLFGIEQILNPTFLELEFTSLNSEVIFRLISILSSIFFLLGLVNYLRMNFTLEREKVLDVNRQLSAAQIIAENAVHLAVNASNAKTEFLTTLSHEIRTPMNAVIGMTNLLIQDNTNKQQLDNLKTLKFSAENLLALINDILDFGKIEAGKISFEKIEFSLKNLACSVNEAFKLRASEKGIELKINLDKNLPETIVSDPTRLTQILNNLIGNAIKFTHKGTVSLNIHLLDKTSNDVKIKFEVIDTGIGIHKNQHEFIFEKFSQASISTTREYGGTGLGLSITKKLLELQNSEIQINSELEKGTSFSFILKLKMGQNEICKSMNNIDQQMFSSLKGIKVLLVDDNKTNILIASKFLKKWDIEVVVAFDGEQAYHYICNDYFSIVLMDIQMPVLDGIGATKLIRKIPDRVKAEVPIIALTASALLDERELILASGMNDFILKPFNPTNLYKKIVEHSQLATVAA